MTKPDFCPEGQCELVPVYCEIPQFGEEGALVAYRCKRCPLFYEVSE